MATVMLTTLQLTSVCGCGVIHMSTHQGSGSISDQAVAAAYEHFDELRALGWQVILGEGSDTAWEAAQGPTASFSVHTICDACTGDGRKL